MNQFCYNMETTTWALKHVLFLLSRSRWRKTKVFIILTRHNQLSNCWTTWSLKLSMKNSLLPIKLNYIIIPQTHYEKSDWSRAFNQFTIACELDMINAISAADIAFIMSTSAWLLSPLESSPQKQNGRTLRFRFWGWIMWKMYNKTIIEFGFLVISWIIKTACLCYLPKPKAEADNTDLGFAMIIHYIMLNLIQ